MAKKYNKGRKQKPNYSKRGLINPRVEFGSDFDIEDSLKKKSDSTSYSKSYSSSSCSKSSRLK